MDGISGIYRGVNVEIYSVLIYTTCIKISQNHVYYTFENNLPHIETTKRGVEADQIPPQICRSCNSSSSSGMVAAWQMHQPSIKILTGTRWVPSS